MMYLVYVCEKCGAPMREALDNGELYERPWTKSHFCLRCQEHTIFLRDGAYSMALAAMADQARLMLVYLFRAENGLYKIGISHDPVSRLAAMGTGPVAIELVWCHQFENADSIERALHNLFSNKRVRGEWFALEAAHLTFIQALGGGSE